MPSVLPGVYAVGLACLMFKGRISDIYCVDRFDVAKNSEVFRGDTTISRDGASGNPNLTIAITLPNGQEEHLELYAKPFFYHPVIVRRGITCWMARRVGGNKWDLVVKDAWRDEDRPPEGDLLLQAAQRGVWGITNHSTHEDVIIQNQLDSTNNAITELTIRMSPVHFLSTEHTDGYNDWVLPPDIGSSYVSDVEYREHLVPVAESRKRKRKAWN